MSVNTTKLVNLASLIQFKTRQDAENENKFLLLENISLDGKGTVTIGDIDSILTASSELNADNLAGAIPSTVTMDASSIISGTIDIARLPAAALERVVTVADQSARFALSTSDIQLGDVVKQTDTGKMYFVVDTANLDNASGYMEFVAGAAAEVPWAGVTGKPNFGTGANNFAIGNHVHGNISNDGKIGSTANLPVITGTDGLVTTGTFGTGQYEFAEGNHDHASNKVTAMTGYSKPVSLTSGHEAIETTDSLNAAIGKLENKVDANATAIAADIASNKVSAMTGYSKPNALTSGHEAIETTDTLNAAIGKLEYKVDADIASNKVSAMTGYSKPNSLTAGHEAVETTDTLNQAVGKLEYKVDDAIAAANNVATDAEIDEEIFGIVAQNNGD